MIESTSFQLNATVYIEFSKAGSPVRTTRKTIILVIIFWNVAMFQYRSYQPQVKRNLISSISNLVYELPHELPNDLRLKILGNEEIFGKSEIAWRHSLVPSLPSRNETLAIAVKQHTKVDIRILFSCPVFYWISLFYSKYFSQDCLSKQSFGLNLAQYSSNFNFMILCILSNHFSNLQRKYKAGQLC